MNYNTPNYTTADRIITGVCYGVFISIFCIIIWLCWAYFIYRWDLDRISEIIVNRYLLFNEKKLDNKTQQYKATDVILSTDKSSVTANIVTINKRTQAPLNSTAVTYKIYNDCTLIDDTCIRV